MDEPQSNQMLHFFQRGSGIRRERISYKWVKSKRQQKSDEVGFVLIAEPDAEALVIEIYRIGEACRRAVMKIRRARGEAVKYGPRSTFHLVPLQDKDV